MRTLTKVLFVLLGFSVMLKIIGKDDTTSNVASATSQPTQISNSKKVVSKQPKSIADSQKWDGHYEGIDCGSAQECAMVAYRIETSNSADKMRVWPYRAVACDLGLATACMLVGSHYANPHINNNINNLKSARDWFNKGCQIDEDFTNCIYVISIDIKTNELERAKDSFKALCTSDLQSMCENTIHLKGALGTNYKKIIKSACAEGHIVSCNIAAIKQL